MSALLWVSADPGCGKSVLARYLVEDVLPSSATRTTCYFFFKDDFDDQKSLEGALCCILHQLFVQKPDLLSEEVLEDFSEEGEQLLASFSKLWSILIRATRNDPDGEIICILDALDECPGQAQLVATLTELYTNDKPGLKFLVTSRPYLKIKREFQNLKESQPTIHLSGESQEEVDKIAQEIAISIKQRTVELCQKLQLSIEEKQVLQEEISTISHRTYLWVHLVFAAIEEAVFLTKDDLRASIRDLPRTVEEAYNKILSKSTNPVKTQKILHIIVAAERPLLLTEMAAALAFRDSHRCHKDLERDLQSPARLHDAIRQTCGLFVVIRDSKVFLLHQTAKEFLVGSEVRPLALKWQHSLDPKESHRLISDISIRYLLLADFREPLNASRNQESDNGHNFVFQDYAACNWADHYRQAHEVIGTGLEPLALQLCDTNSLACSHWLKVYGVKRMGEPKFMDELPSSLMIASHFGLDDVVNIILKADKKSIALKATSSQRTALSWASEKGYNLVVQSHLQQVAKYKVVFKDWLRSPTIVSAADGLGRTPLWYASVNGHRDIVQQLLQKGAKVNTRDENRLTPLSWAVHYGHNDIVALLLDHGARQNHRAGDLETRDRNGYTPLQKAAKDGNEAGAQLLLNYGSKIEARDKYGETALIAASRYGHDAIIKLLLDRNPEIEARDKYGETALIAASRYGHDAIVKLLLDRGPEIEARDKYGETALIAASRNGHDAIIKLLLDRGPEIEVRDKYGETALIAASRNGHDASIRLLLDRGAEIEARDKNGWTALMAASRNGQDAIIKLLIDRGASKR